jgi:hypothetical protein
MSGPLRTVREVPIAEVNGAWGVAGGISLNEGLLPAVSVTRGASCAEGWRPARYHRDLGKGFGATLYGDIGVVAPRSTGSARHPRLRIQILDLQIPDRSARRRSQPEFGLHRGARSLQRAHVRTDIVSHCASLKAAAGFAEVEGLCPPLSFARKVVLSVDVLRSCRSITLPKQQQPRWQKRRQRRLMPGGLISPTLIDERILKKTQPGEND